MTQQPPPPSSSQQAEAWPPKDSTIVARSLSKSFRGGLVALSELSVAIGPGVTALLGPNGAGKSTFMRLLCGLTKATTGDIWVAGGNPRKDAAVRGRIGLVPQQDGIFERQQVYDFVYLAAVLHNVDDPQSATLRALELVELNPQELTRPLGSFSKGMRQRAKIAQAIVHDPDVIVLDEPLNGLDPKQRRHMIALFHSLGEQGKTILVSSHILEEVERFGSHIVVLSKGRLAAEGDFRSIRSLMDHQPRKVKIACDKPKNVAARLIESSSIASCTLHDEETFEITTADAGAFRKEIAIACQKSDSLLSEVTPLDEDLESVFRYLVGER